MCIIKFSTQQHNGIYDTTNNLKIIISVRGGNLLFLQCLVYSTSPIAFEKSLHFSTLIKLYALHYTAHSLNRYRNIMSTGNGK